MYLSRKPLKYSSLTRFGSPSWLPEDSPMPHRPEGIQIGDVCVLNTESGGFDVIFNATLPWDDPFNQKTGVPRNFSCIPLLPKDIASYRNAVDRGRVLHGPDVEVDHSGCAELSRYKISSTTRGEALLLPDGAQSYELRSKLKFTVEATQHAIDWYDFAEKRLGRTVSPDSLFIVTGYHRARSWVITSFQRAPGGSAQVNVTRLGGGKVTVTCAPQDGLPMEYRVGDDNVNLTLFVQKLHISVSDHLFGITRRIHIFNPDVPNSPSVSTIVAGRWPSKLWNIVQTFVSRSFHKDPESQRCPFARCVMSISPLALAPVPDHLSHVSMPFPVCIFSSPIHRVYSPSLLPILNASSFHRLRITPPLSAMQPITLTSLPSPSLS